MVAEERNHIRPSGRGGYRGGHGVGQSVEEMYRIRHLAGSPFGHARRPSVFRQWPSDRTASDAPFPLRRNDVSADQGNAPRAARASEELCGRLGVETGADREALPRRAAARTVDALWNVIAAIKRRPTHSGSRSPRPPPTPLAPRSLH